MLGRRTLMVLSVVLSVLLYVGFLMAAPHILVINAGDGQSRALRTFRVELKDMEPVSERMEKDEAKKGEAQGVGSSQEQAASRPISDLSSRPGSMTELLARTDDQSMEGQLFQVATAEIPNLVARVSTDYVPREHDLGYSDIGAKRADAKIIEIARETARLDINVPRRFVQPSPDRFLDAGTYPTLRSEGAEPPHIPIELDSGGISLLGQPVSMPVHSGESGATSGATVSLTAATPPPEPPPLPKETVKALEKPLAEAPVNREMKAVRAESQYVFLDDLVDIKMSAFKASDDRQGFFALVIQPKDSGKIDVLPKDITFVIDASRSMIQRKLDAAARSTAELVGKLRPEDQFNVVVFRDTPLMFKANRVPASKANKTAAQAFVKGLESKGQTDVYGALKAVVEEKPRAGIPGIILLVSDGRPTTGIQDSREVINAVTVENNLRNSLFAFGAGSTVNRYLLDLLAYRNIGRASVIEKIEEMDGKLGAFFEEFSEPLLTDIRVDYGHVNREEIYPRAIPNFYRKGGVKVFGRFDPERDREFVMRLSGNAGSKRKEVVFRANLSEASKAGVSIASEWAFAKAYHIIGEISRQGETPELLQELKQLSAKYNIRTVYNQ